MFHILEILILKFWLISISFQIINNSTFKKLYLLFLRIANNDNKGLKWI